MFRRTLFFATAVGAVVGGPYLASQWPKMKASFLGKPAASQAAGSSESSWSAASTQAAGAGVSQYDPRIGLVPNSDETPIVDMAEAFRFDVTPTWVMSRWPRVSANPFEKNLHGLRVALISGTRSDDLAGSLTYYFTSEEHCAKITFSGTTGDPGRFINLMMSRFSFKPFSKGEPGVLRYEIRWNGKTLSELTVRSAAIIRSNAPLARYEVQLSLVNSDAR